jgi:hypothetical protein
VSDQIDVEGPIGFLNRDTDDGRRVAELEVGALPLPVLTNFRTPDGERVPGPFNDERMTAAGAITDVEIRGDVVWATGVLYEWSGHDGVDRWPVGMDVDPGVAVLLHPDGSQTEEGDDLFDPTLVEEMSGRLIGLHLYRDGQVPAWPDAHLARMAHVAAFAEGRSR